MGKYLLLDRRILNPQGMDHVRLTVTQPVKDKAHFPLFGEDRPWEARIDNGYPNVLYDPEAGMYHCYYTLFIEDKGSEGRERKERARRDYVPRPDRVPGLAYARSRDGIHWEKPGLNRVMWRGSGENNLIFPYAHGTGVMMDREDPDPSRRFKLVTKIDKPGKETYMAVAFSPDAVGWGEPIRWPEHNPVADSHNFPFWDSAKGCYLLMSRIWKDGIRITTVSESPDFLHWSEPEEALRGRGFEAQVYSMPVFPWEGLYLSLASIIHEGNRSAPDFDTVDLELAWSTDGRRFDFAAAGQSLIPRGGGRYPGGEPDCGCIYASPPVLTPDGRMWVYYMGGNGRHTNFRESSLLRAGWEPDRFASMEPDGEGEEGVLATCQMCVKGKDLEILAEPMKEGGSLEAAVCPSWSQEAFEGFSYRDCQVLPSQDGWQKVGFAGGLEHLSGREASLKLRLRDMRVWAIRGGMELERHRLWEGA